MSFSSHSIIIYSNFTRVGMVQTLNLVIGSFKNPFKLGEVYRLTRFLNKFHSNS